MIRVYTIQNNKLHQYKSPQLDEMVRLNDVIWIDLQSPTQGERDFVEKNYKIEFFTSQEVQEIESSSRFLETDETVEINLGFVNLENEMTVQNVTFILKENILFTYRQSDLKIFADSVRKLKTLNPSTSYQSREHGLNVFLTILETRIDSDADMIEGINRRVNVISKMLIARKSLKEDLLLGIARLQENTMLLHQTVTEKQRVVSSLIRIP